MNVRRVKAEDAAPIADIYNFYVSNTHHTFETEKITLAGMRKRIGEIAGNFPFLVCEENGEIFGYAFATRYKARQAYRHSVEVSVYVKDGSHKKGIGKSLYQGLLESLAETDVHAIIAGIALPNDASVRLHERFGFEKVAHFREVGFKFGRWIDVGYWELINR